MGANLQQTLKAKLLSADEAAHENEPRPGA